MRLPFGAYAFLTFASVESHTCTHARTGTTWTAGSNVEVSWAMKAWHGGGYTYRLAPADGPLTEETFNKMSLKFVGNSSFRWGGLGGERLYFNSTARGWEVSEGTFPEGSMWRKNPIARTVTEWYMYGAAFEPVCEESPACRNSHYRVPPPGVCKCSGDWNDLLEVCRYDIYKYIYIYLYLSIICGCTD